MSLRYLANIRLAEKYFQGTNTLAYFTPTVEEEKSVTYLSASFPFFDSESNLKQRKKILLL